VIRFRSGRPSLSVVVVAYDMARELPRTLRSLAPGYQQGIAADDYEVIVVDNGSPTPVDEAAFAALGSQVQLVRVDPAPPSPAHAANVGAEVARADFVGLLIDGARIASPRVLAHALLARHVAARPVVATLGWHLGTTLHANAGEAGYDRAAEDRLLAELDWVQASVHGGQRMPARELTKRVEEALRNQHVSCLSHPKGRLINYRPENALDLGRVFEVALEEDVAVEVNGLPNRLDLSGEHVRHVLDAGVTIVCSTDGHAPASLGYMPLSVHTARRGVNFAGALAARRAAERGAQVSLLNKTQLRHPRLGTAR